jgi:hypothetical protein
MQSSFPTSAMGLPAALKYDLPPSMSDSARAYSVNVAPDGITSVAGPVGAISFATTVSQPAFTSQNVSFTIPSGMSDSVFMDTASTTLSFTLTYTVGTASSVSGTNNACNLIGSAASFFDALQLYSNNVPIETINQYGLLQNFLLQNTANLSERNGGISIAMGADTNSATGIELATASTGTFRYSFCIPLLSVIGYNTDKFFPIGSVNNLQLIMTTAALSPIVAYAPTVTTNVTLSTGPTLSEFRLNMKYIDVGDVAAAMLRQTLQDGKWFIKSSTYTNSAVNIPSGSQGAQQVLLQIRNSSVRSVFHQFGIAAGNVSPNGAYDAVNIGQNLRQLQIGGAFFPNYPINDSQRPAEGYPYLIQALGGSIPKSFGTVVTREMYNSVAGASVPSGSDNTLVLPATVSRAAPTGSDGGGVSVIKYPSGAYYGYDLEKSAGILFQGVNTRAQPPFLNLNLAGATSAAVTCQAWGLSDVVLVIDHESKQCTAFI